jgi:hypothetical protein
LLIIAQCKRYTKGIQKQSNMLCEKFNVCGGHYLEYMGRGDNEWRINWWKWNFFWQKFTFFNTRKGFKKSILWIRVVFLCHVCCKALILKARSCHHVNLRWPLVTQRWPLQLVQITSKLKLQSSNLIKVNKLYSCYFLPIPKSSLLKPLSSKLVNVHSNFLRQVAICKIFEFGRL